MEDVTSVIRTDIVSTSTLNVVAAATTEDDNNLNAKFHLECENSAVDLNGIQQEDPEWFMKQYTVDNDNDLAWTLKKYRVDNNSINDTELEWIRKKYRVDNDFIKLVIQLVIQAVLVMSQLIFRSVCQAVRMMLKMEFRSTYQVVVNNNNYDNNHKDYLSRTDVDVRWYYYFGNSNNGEIP